MPSSCFLLTSVRVGHDLVESLVDQEILDLADLRLLVGQFPVGHRELSDRLDDVFLRGEAEDLLVDVALFVQVHAVFVPRDFPVAIRRADALQHIVDHFLRIVSAEAGVEFLVGESEFRLLRGGLIVRGSPEDLHVLEEQGRERQDFVQALLDRIRVRPLDK